MFMRDNGLNRIHREVIDYLDDNYAFFLTHVLKLGKPLWTSAIPTAAVALPDEKADPDDFSYVFNPDFLSGLETHEAGFVYAHETMHIILNHLRLAQNSHFSHKMLFNIAADCVINDFLVDNGLVSPEGLCHGMKLVGYNCANRTVTEVYDDLKKQAGCTCDQKGDQKGDKGEQGDQKGEGKGDQDGQGDGSGDQDGEGGSGDSGDCPLHGQYKSIDDHGWMHNPNQGQADKLDDLWDMVEGDMPQNMEDMRDDINYDRKMGSMAGPGVGREQDFVKNTGAALEWVELLKEIDPDVFRGRTQGPPPMPSYHKPRRKLMGFYPDTVLPVERENPRRKDGKLGKPAIVMALDTSGSIGPDDARRFISLAQTIPTDKIHLFPITFTTVYKELDLENPKFNDGGTSFACIQQYIVDKVKPELDGRYPRAVVVVTDGYASFGVGPSGRPDTQEGDSWYWLITEAGGSYGGYNDWQTVGKNDKLTRFIK